MTQDYEKCPSCEGYADNGFDRSDPPQAYECTKCKNNTMTTPRIEEFVDDVMHDAESFIADYSNKEWFRARVTSALKEAHRAGRGEAVEIKCSMECGDYEAACPEILLEALQDNK